MYHKLPINITKRYLYIIHQCLQNLNNDDKILIRENGNLDISKIFLNPNFNIFISYMEDLINRKKINTNNANLIFLFLDNIVYKHNNKEQFYKFFRYNKKNLITNPSFLKYFLLKEINLKIKNNTSIKDYENLNNALKLIEINLPKSFKNNLNSKNRYINIQNDFGLINSLTITKCYDLIFLSLNNPLFLIIEQIIHEQTHINFGLLIETKKYELLFNIPYSAFSPFAQKVRSIEYIANGYCAFVSVFNLYTYYLKNYSKIKNQFEIPNIKTIKSRIKILAPRIKEAEIILENIFGDNQLWSKFKGEFSYDFNVDVKAKVRKSFKFNPKFTNIQNAEIILGLNTDKVARITIPISQTVEIFNLLPSNNYFFSNDAFLDSKNEDIESFKNMHLNIGSHINSYDDQNTFVNCYIGKSLQTLKKAAEKDQIDNAGNYFKIPKCCQDYFNTHWAKIVSKHKGDFVKYSLQKVKNNNSYKWQVNSLAMYFDAGYTWHFPCNFNCKHTILISQNRYEALKKLNKKLAEKLKKEAIGSFSLLSDNNYLREFDIKKTFTSKNFNSNIIKKINFI